MTITDRMPACRRERRVLPRVWRAAWRREQAERERGRALAAARAGSVVGAWLTTGGTRDA